MFYRFEWILLLWIFFFGGGGEIGITLNVLRAVHETGDRSFEQSYTIDGL